MIKPIPIIEYQEELQRTPKELMEFLSDSKIERMVIIYVDDNGLAYIPSSVGRDFNNAQIHWDLTRVRNFLIEDK